MGNVKQGTWDGTTMSVELRNTMCFHMGDFIGVNNADWDLFRYYHADDVIVDLGGQRTVGVDAHFQAMQGLMSQFPSLLIVRHSPNVAQGDWTATVGYLQGYGPDEVRVVTVARWQGGEVVEEYLFMRELPEGSAVVDVTGPAISISTPDDDELRLAAGVEPGWTCNVYGTETGTKTAVLTRTVGDQVLKRLVFAEV